MNTVFRIATLSILSVSAQLLSVPAIAHGDGHAAHGSAAPNAVSAFGHAAAPGKATRTVTVNMGYNMRFSPDTIEVRRGEVVRIHVVNQGQVDHEFVLGDREELEAHAKMMRDMPGMVHRDANAIRLAPAKEGDIVWAFTRAGKFLYACQVPGHREAGMQGTIVVRRK